MRKILIIHPKCCIRAIKQIEGLLANGDCSISLVTHKKKYIKNIPDYIKDNIKIINFRFRRIFYKRFLFKLFLRKIIFNYDIIHCHNEPNYHVVDILKVANRKVPVVYDIHDFTSMRSGIKNNNEAYAYKNSDAIIHVNDDFIKYGESLYGKKKCYTIYSTPSKKYTFKPKNDLKNKSLHFVYQGGIYDHEFAKNSERLKLGSYRNYLPYFNQILEEGHHVHLFTGNKLENLPSYIKLKNKFSKFHFHGRYNYNKLLKKMNDFDYGIVGFNFDNIKEKSAIKYLNFAMGNKLFDYLFSGIKPIVINAKSMADFVIKNNCGYVKMSSVTWTESVKDAYFDYDNQYKIINEYCIENQTQKLLSIYDELLDGGKK